MLSCSMPPVHRSFLAVSFEKAPPSRRQESTHHRHQKYLAYERAGEGAYWILDPVHSTLEVWFWEDGSFARHGAFGRGDRFTSRTLAHAVELKALFPAEES